MMAAAACLAMVWPAFAAIAYGPQLQQLTPTSAVILWSGSGTELKYGTSPGSLTQTAAVKVGTPNLATLSGLTEETAYYFRITGETHAINTFRTSSDTLRTLSFVVMGDSKAGVTVLDKLCSMIKGRSLAFTCFLGDMTDDGNLAANWSSQWANRYASALGNVDILPTPGNHERWPSGRTLYDQHFAPGGNADGTYSFRYGPVLVVSLVLDDRPPGDQDKYLESVLSKASVDSGIHWRFLQWHKPCYTWGSHRAREGSVAKPWVKVAEKYGVDAVFCGHNHLYERTVPIKSGKADSTGIVFMTLGGAGADLSTTGSDPLLAKTQSVNHYLQVDIVGDTAKFTARDLSGKAFDVFAIVKKPPFTNADRRD
jgi:hypothetical protein